MSGNCFSSWEIMHSPFDLHMSGICLKWQVLTCLSLGRLFTDSPFDLHMSGICLKWQVLTCLSLGRLFTDSPFDLHMSGICPKWQVLTSFAICAGCDLHMSGICLKWQVQTNVKFVYLSGSCLLTITSIDKCDNC